MGNQFEPKSKSSKAKSKADEKEWGFINYNLTAKDKSDLADMDYDTEFPNELAFAAVEEGYKFSLSYNAKNDTYVASLTDLQEASDYFKKTLSGYGSSPRKAFISLMYRHCVLAVDGDWTYLDKIKSEDVEDFS